MENEFKRPLNVKCKVLCNAVYSAIFTSNGPREESFQETFTNYYDVPDLTFLFNPFRWSYGILLWEIMTYGDQPYPQVFSEHLLEFLQEGNRMEKPQRCSLNM